MATAAKALNDLRGGWLDPPGATEEELAGRTLNALYNDNPAWLQQAHQALDDAVHEAYDWSPALEPDQVLERLLELNLSRRSSDGS